ncbi:hypothetical protein EB061_08590 [bacterium]|jgi:hypothetical protein|nr:hypothetical protein [bacterium]
MAKDDKTNTNLKDFSEVQGISMDALGGTIPGVTQLLNPGLERKQSVTTAKGKMTKINLKFAGTSTGMRKLENNAENSPKTEAPEAPRTSKNASLEDLGVKQVLVFSRSGNVHRFESAEPKSPEPLAAWQNEFFRGMVLDPSILSLSGEFNEFSAKKSRFEADAFGLEISDWLTLMSSGSRIMAIISKNTLAKNRADLENLWVPGKQPEENSGDFKIETA